MATILPSKPKNIITAYNYFTPFIRAAVKEEYPLLINNELNKIIGAKWKAMSMAEKKPFEDMAVTDKKRYLDEVDAYNEQAKDNFIASRINDSEGNTGAKASLNIPPPRNSYGIFSSQEYQFVSSLGKGLNINLQPLTGAYMGARWNHMCPEEKSLYEQLARSENETYQMKVKRQRLNNGE